MILSLKLYILKLTTVIVIDPQIVNFKAFDKKFNIICLILFGSEFTNLGIFSSYYKIREIFFIFACTDINERQSSISSYRSKSTIQNLIFPFSIYAKSKISFIRFNYSLLETKAGIRNDFLRFSSYRRSFRISNIEIEQFKGVLIS